MLKLTSDDFKLVNDAGSLSATLSIVSQEQRFLSNSPEAMSLMLFRRLASNYNGFVLLWNAELAIEPAIILRAGIEAAICIAANYVLRDAFVSLAREDTIATLKKQIRKLREDGFIEMVRAGEATLRGLSEGLSSETKAQSFDWRDLAVKGGVPQLYHQHRSLSSMSAHVTGFSMLRGIVGEDGAGAESQAELKELERSLHLMQMVGAVLIGCKLHADLLHATDCQTEANRLVAMLNAHSSPGP